MTNQIKPRLSRLFVLLFWSSLRNAACHPSSDWLVQPDNETRVVFTEDRVEARPGTKCFYRPTLVFPKTVSDTELCRVEHHYGPPGQSEFCDLF